MKREFTAPGKPVAKGRPIASRGRPGQKFVRMRTPKKTLMFENYVRERYLTKYLNGPLMEGPLEISVVAVFGVPKSWPKKRRAAARWKISTPDLDNIVKAVVDALNEVAFHDDAQVVRITAEKRYGARPQTRVVISTIEEGGC